MQRKHNKVLTSNARNLRKNMTAEERKLWFDFLSDYPVRILRQKIVGNFIVDFYCAKAKIVIELDGSQHYSIDGEQKDVERTKSLKTYGLKVIRFSNRAVNQNFQGVCRSIDNEISERIGFNHSERNDVMLTDVIFRRAEAKDIAAMAALISLIFAVEEDFAIDAAKQRRGLEMLLEQAEGCYLLAAEYQGSIIGMCSAQLLVSTAEGGLKALVEDVVVKKEFRGKGIGKRMLLVIEEWAVSKGAKRLDLLADRDNTNGLKFYEKLEWKQTNLIALQKKSKN